MTLSKKRKKFLDPLSKIKERWPIVISVTFFTLIILAIFVQCFEFIKSFSENTPSRKIIIQTTFMYIFFITIHAVPLVAIHLRKMWSFIWCAIVFSLWSISTFMMAYYDELNYGGYLLSFLFLLLTISLFGKKTKDYLRGNLG